MPGKKKKYNARFPPARIKKIMQSDEEVGKVAAPVPVIISRALELFVHSLLTRAGKVTAARHAKTLTPSHLKQCIISEQRFDFLQELFTSVPDINTETEQDSEPLTPLSTSSSLPFSSQDSVSHGVASIRARGRGRGRGRRSVDEAEAPKSYKYRRHRMARKQTSSTTSIEDDGLEDNEDEDSDEVLQLDLESTDTEESDSERHSVHSQALNHSKSSSRPSLTLSIKPDSSSTKATTDSSTPGLTGMAASPFATISSSSLPGGIQISIPGLAPTSIPLPASSPFPGSVTSPTTNSRNGNSCIASTGKSLTCVPVPVITSAKQQKLSHSFSKVEIDEDYDC